MLAEIGTTSNTLEECYERMLAYAAQGLPTDEGSQSGAEVRECLARAAVALTGLIVASADPAGVRQVDAFLDVLDRDARSSLAAIELVLAQPSISSQLIDNLNASIHLRALLTDLFLLSEIAAAGRARPLPVVGNGVAR